MTSMSRHGYNLEGLIADLKSSLDLNRGIISHFKYPSHLYSALVEISQLIGLEGVKSTVAGLVISHIVRSHDQAQLQDDTMNHILLLGPPGTGKTTSAKLIAKVICAIGFLETDVRDEAQQETTEDTTRGVNGSNVFDVISSIHKGRIKMLEGEVKALRGNIAESNHLINQCRDSLSVLGSKLADSNCDSLGRIKTNLDQVTSYLTLDDNEVDLPETTNEDQSETDFEEKIVIAPRDMLVAGYIGQTAIKVKKKIIEAIGGVLFIDEAYNMLNSNNSGVESFSQEAISTIVGCMSKYNKNLVVIMAGYEKETLEILRSNQGMARRFGHIISIQDYTVSQVIQIFTKQLSKVSLRLDPAIKVKEVISRNCNHSGLNGGMTNKLVTSLQTIYSQKRYQEIISEQVETSTIGLITQPMFELGLSSLEEHSEIIQGKDKLIHTMYS